MNARPLIIAPLFIKPMANPEGAKAREPYQNLDEGDQSP